ncbi:MAG: dTDP-4-dehydrorhamnose reductase [Thermoleophilaceae bacterium]
MKVLVTGGSGMLGTDVARAAAFVNHEVVSVGHDELDIADAEAVRARIASELPDAVVNCAAYTNVDGAEDDLRGAMDVNGHGARNVAEAAAIVEAPVVFVSTDYVFDGTKDGPYVESDDVHPLSVYGQSKLAGEHETARSGERHFVVRTSWLFGTAGRNFVETMLGLAADHGEVVVVRDQLGCPTYTGHLADAIVRLLDTRSYGVHHISGDGSCSWYDFAREIFGESGTACRVMSCTTDETGRRAPRPRNSVLVTEREDTLLLPDWREGLRSYLAERVAAPDRAQA